MVRHYGEFLGGGVSSGVSEKVSTSRYITIWSNSKCTLIVDCGCEFGGDATGIHAVVSAKIQIMSFVHSHRIGCSRTVCIREPACDFQIQTAASPRQADSNQPGQADSHSSDPAKEFEALSRQAYVRTYCVHDPGKLIKRRSINKKGGEACGRKPADRLKPGILHVYIVYQQRWH
ncbi:hypothetical protein B0H11DRAFT_14561 [Mycena galericulata]|nr:hypothetical protein B0H11DRAFT_14561 [Mycena galericulata]